MATPDKMDALQIHIDLATENLAQAQKQMLREFRTLARNTETEVVALVGSEQYRSTSVWVASSVKRIQELEIQRDLCVRELLVLKAAQRGFES